MPSKFRSIKILPDRGNPYWCIAFIHSERNEVPPLEFQETVSMMAGHDDFFIFFKTLVFMFPNYQYTYTRQAGNVPLMVTNCPLMPTFGQQNLLYMFASTFGLLHLEKLGRSSVYRCDFNRAWTPWFRYEGTVIKRRLVSFAKSARSCASGAPIMPRARASKKTPADHLNHFLKAPT